MIKLSQHPDLIDRLEAILDIASNTSGNFEKASATEEQIIHQMRKLGRDVLQTWAVKQSTKKAGEFAQKNSKATKHGKKNSIGNQPMEP